ncbi:MAG: DUF4825 domain-containing protein [Acutalibacteraceae bacterium]
MNKIPCEIIRDLFPSYIEGLTAEKTNTAVREHIEDCESCRNLLRELEPLKSPTDSEKDKKEIDFLKKQRRKSHARMFLAVLVTIAIILGSLSAVYCLKPVKDFEAKIAPIRVSQSVSGSKWVSFYAMSTREDTVIRDGSVEVKDGVLNLNFKGRRRIPMIGRYYQSNCTKYDYSGDGITQVNDGDRVLWYEGKNISPITSAAFSKKHLYIGDMSANAATAAALNIGDYLGSFTNALYTNNEPYGWKLILERRIPAVRREESEKLMKKYACALLGTVENLSYVTFSYTVDGTLETRDVTVTAEQATDYFGENIKNCYQNIGVLQRLMDKTGLSELSYAPVNTNFDERITASIHNETHLCLYYMLDYSVASVSITFNKDDEVIFSSICTNADGKTDIGSGDILVFDCPLNTLPDTSPSGIVTAKITLTNSQGLTEEIEKEIVFSSVYGNAYEWMITRDSTGKLTLAQ